MLHNVKLDVYEGPIDLLLYLVRRGEIDIHRVPIAKIAKEYYEYVRLLEVIDLAAAGEFIAMAVTLLRLKLQMLLPSTVGESTDLEPSALINPEEYLEVKELAQQLAEMEFSAGDYFSRPRPLVEKEEYEEEQGLSFFDLLSAFKEVMERQRETGLYRVDRVQLTVEERMEEILETLKEGEPVTFFQLFEGEGRLMLVTTFLAILELIRVQRIRAIQPRPFGSIRIYLSKVARPFRPA